MRQDSVDSIKHPPREGHPRIRCNEPQQGTDLRKIYDLLMSNKGKPVSITRKGSVMTQLRDFYCLDIRCIHHKLKTNEYILAGEWVGKVYIDYIADRIEQHNAQSTGGSG